ncbi:MAG: nucleotide pyrophosphohydrolase [Deltaproteobacteria bacterium]
MELKELQSIVDKWISEYGVRYFDEKTNTLLLMEEVGEFSRLIARKYGEQSFKVHKTDDEIRKEIGDEMSDILFVLTCLANQMGFDLEELISANLTKKTTRDEVRHKNNLKLY